MYYSCYKRNHNALGPETFMKSHLFYNSLICRRWKMSSEILGLWGFQSNFKMSFQFAKVNNTKFEKSNSFLKFLNHKQNKVYILRYLYPYAPNVSSKIIRPLLEFKIRLQTVLGPALQGKLSTLRLSLISTSLHTAGLLNSW